MLWSCFLEAAYKELQINVLYWAVEQRLFRVGIYAVVAQIV
jgi:hypothetical protein